MHIQIYKEKSSIITYSQTDKTPALHHTNGGIISILREYIPQISVSDIYRELLSKLHFTV